MPILPAEPNVYPTNLFQEEVSGGERRWWVLHTKPRQEKLLARQIRRTETSFYLPLIERKTVVRGRLMKSHVPLFAGYLFLLADGKERVEALATGRVVRSLEVSDQQELWRDLSQVHRLIASGLPVTPEDRLYPGAKVVIRTGPLAGLQGKIIREATRRRFVVQIDFIQRGASAILEEYMLAAVGD